MSPAPQPLTLLVAAPMAYHPACGNGGGVLCFEVLKRLAPHARLHFAAFAAPGAEAERARAALAPLCASVTLVPPPPPRGRLAGWWAQLVQGRPREQLDCDSPVMAAALSALAARAQVQVALLQFPHMAPYVAALPGVPVVVDTQDVATASRWREWQAARGAARRLSRGSAWWAWLRHERRWYARASRLMALSDTDLGVLRAFVPEVPAFLSPVACAPAAPRRRDQGSRRVVFVGHFDHAPNRDALQWLLAEVWPRVRRLRPQARLLVAGKRIPAGTERPGEGVVALGFVDDLGGLFASAAASLVPYRFGGGVKIKALEAMAQGCPLVATTIGIEGLHVEHRRQVLVADEPAAFAGAIVELLDDPGLGCRLAEAARDHVARHFSWERKLRTLLDQLRLLAGAEPAAAAGAGAGASAPEATR